jgi:hypothetical protein
MLIGQEVGHSLRIEANLQLLRHHRQTVRPHRRPISARRKVRSVPPSWRSVTASSASATIMPVVEFVAHHPAVPTFDAGDGQVDERGATADGDRPEATFDRMRLG